MRLPLFILILFICGCTGNSPSTEAHQDTQDTNQTKESVERLSPELDAVIGTDAKIEVLADGFTWSEGPLWVDSLNALLFSDVPQNKIYKWSAESGLSVFLEPSGFTGYEDAAGESGSNGLTLDSAGNLVLCQHGDRRVAQLEADFDKPSPTFKTLTDNFEGKRFNSPNDLVFDSKGNLYFTDPPYGLGEPFDSHPAKELPFQGVFQLTSSGELNLITDQLSRPNGIALSPDERTLYVANSDPDRAIWMAFPIDEAGTVGTGQIFHDATPALQEDQGLPDGLKVNSKGIIFASGPGGIWIFTPQAKLLGKIRPGSLVSNCSFGATEQQLYLTADKQLVRVALK